MLHGMYMVAGLTTIQHLLPFGSNFSAYCILATTDSWVLSPFPSLVNLPASHPPSNNSTLHKYKDVSTVALTDKGYCCLCLPAMFQPYKTHTIKQKRHDKRQSVPLNGPGSKLLGEQKGQLQLILDNNYLENLLKLLFYFYKLRHR
jgi:hypothetical protein